MNQTDKDILINKAIALFNLGKLERCLEETILAKKKYPDEPFIYNLLGILFAHSEDYEDSIKNYTKAIKLNPNYFEAYNNIGVAYTSWKKNDKAIQYFDKAIKINPLYAEAFNNKGNALKEKGEYQSAVRFYEKSLRINQNYIDAITNLGIIWDMMNDSAKAESYFQKALSFNPANTSALYNLANCLFNSGDFERSIKVCKEIIGLDTSFYYAYNRIGLCYLQLENQKEAKVFFEKAVKINPDYAEGLTNYGFVLQKLRDFHYFSKFVLPPGSS